MKNRLKELRIEKGLTQEELGNQLGLANNTISRYETGSNEPLKLRIAEMQLNAVATAYKNEYRTMAYIEYCPKCGRKLEK